MRVYQNILETIGNTPMVKLNTITKDLPCTVYAKIETTNPGNSIKDRMAVKMILDAEASGALKPGGVIIEGTSGNTGMGLAIAAVVKGYRCIFTTTDKQSKENVDALKAFGAEVIVCPTDVEPEDPRTRRLWLLGDRKLRGLKLKLPFAPGVKLPAPNGIALVGLVMPGGTLLLPLFIYCFIIFSCFIKSSCCFATSEFPI